MWVYLIMTCYESDTDRESRDREREEKKKKATQTDEGKRDPNKMIDGVRHRERKRW